jgi:hypothetical protein
MKHLFNDISSEEKNRILEMHKRAVDFEMINEEESETMELFYVMNNQGHVKNISKTESAAEKFLKNALKDDGTVKSKIVYEKDYYDEKITVATIKRYKMK